MVNSPKNKSFRTDNTLRNMKVSLVAQMFSLCFVFVGRAVFIRYLSIEYLGINGLFTNVLELLSFAELGIGSAIVYNLYKPLSEDDIPKICALMQFYKIAYFFIGAIIAGIGIALIPFLDALLKTKPNIPENIICIYLLFLTDTVMSYYFIYKRNLIIADQKIYIVSIYVQCFNAIRTAMQIVFLWLTKSYIIYLLIQIMGTLICNYALYKKADKMYPYLTKSVLNSLSIIEVRSIFSDVKAIALYKLCSAVLYGMPNIIISKYIGIVSVGLVSNYVIITGALNTIANQLSQSMMSSIGNLNAGIDINKQKNVFYLLMFAHVWLYGYVSVCIFCLANKFISAWLGDCYVLNIYVILTMVIAFYIDKLRNVPYMYRVTLGYFVQGKWIALLAVLINIPLSIFMALKIGVAGVFLAMAISTLCTFMIIDPLLIYTKRFESSVLDFYKKCIKDTIIISIIGYLVFAVNNLLSIRGFLGFIIYGIIDTIIFNCIFVVIYHNTMEFKILRRIIVEHCVGKHCVD